MSDNWAAIKGDIDTALRDVTKVDKVPAAVEQVLTTFSGLLSNVVQGVANNGVAGEVLEDLKAVVGLMGDLASDFGFAVAQNTDAAPKPNPEDQPGNVPQAGGPLPSTQPVEETPTTEEPAAEDKPAEEETPTEGEHKPEGE
jgi:hypothetical protein